MPEVFGILDDLVADGKLRFYGVSVEHVEEALRAARHPNVQSIQIIFNMFRLKPAEELFPVVREKRIGILARVPLASGLLSGKLRRDSTFAPTDHRNYNRHGEAFDVGETFSGVDYETGLRGGRGAARARPSPARRWRSSRCAGSSCSPRCRAAIPGAKNVRQTEDNVRAADLPALSDDVMARVRDVYDRHDARRWCTTDGSRDRRTRCAGGSSARRTSP